jgi:hypothetical protein
MQDDLWLYLKHNNPYEDIILDHNRNTYLRLKKAKVKRNEDDEMTKVERRPLRLEKKDDHGTNKNHETTQERDSEKFDCLGCIRLDEENRLIRSILLDGEGKKWSNYHKFFRKPNGKTMLGKLFGASEQYVLLMIFPCV